MLNDRCCCPQGGGILQNGGILTISGSNIYSNSVLLAHGGGIATNQQATLTISGSNIYSNEAVFAGTGYGAGIYFDGATLIISESNIYLNQADASGGGVAVRRAAGGARGRILTLTVL